MQLTSIHARHTRGTGRVGPRLRLALSAALFAALLAGRLHGQPVDGSPFTVKPGLRTNDGTITAEVGFHVPAGHHLYADELAFEIDGRQTKFSCPAPIRVVDRHSGDTRPVYHGDFTATYPLTSWPSAGWLLTVRWRGCNDAECFFPESQTWRGHPSGGLTVAPAEGPSETGAPVAATTAAGSIDGVRVTSRVSGYLGAREFLEFLRADPPSGSGAVEGAGTGGAALAGAGMVMTLVLILLGGLALNLTPCVLPMIPINLAILGAGAGQGNRRRGFVLGGAYGAGMAAAYGGLGLAVVLTGSRFGTLNSSAWFNFAIAGVFVVLALGMFDRLPIDLSRFQGAGGARAAGGGALMAAGTMGAVSALLAGACVAPVVISVLLLATTRYQAGQPLGLLLPFVLGVGMALPWPFAAAGLSFLPKPGAWMTRVKHGFGVIIFAFAAWYGWLGWSLTDGWRTHARESRGADRQMASLNSAVAESTRTGRPVLVDFWASWCKNCSAMEHTTLQDPSVQQALTNFIVVRFQAERPGDAATEPVLKRFGVLGLPTYVIVQPESSAGTPVRMATSINTSEH